MTQRLSKTDFLHYLHCPKSLWLARHKPHLVPAPKPDAHASLVQQQGYDVEAAIEAWLGPKGYTAQVVFEAANGAYARTDLVRENADGSLDLIEVKGGVSVKKSHLYDIGFQACIAEMTGHKVRAMYVAQIRKDRVKGAHEPPFVLRDVTDQVSELLADIRTQIALALDLLNTASIDETSCTCLLLSRANHCETFDHFNANIPRPSIYSLPRMDQGRLTKFVESDRFSLDSISENEVSASQKKSLWAMQNGAPFVDHGYIDQFVGALEFPLYFYDYEAFATPLPQLDSTKPYQQIPFQYSLHILHGDGRLDHIEFLAEDWEVPVPLLDHLTAHIGQTGSIVSWNKGYENGRNKDMAALLPHYETALNDIVARTVDLQDIFKHGYVHGDFNGSTSIKNVLPVMAPELTYANLEVSNGGEAMVAFAKMLGLPQGGVRDQLRADMLAYCALDSFAMVRLFQAVQDIQSARITP